MPTDYRKDILDFKYSSNSSKDGIVVTLPLRTVSESNTREHYFVKAKRHTIQKQMVTLALRKHKQDITFPCTLTVTRYAPGTLDKHDNLPMSMKWIVDACCECITGEKRAGRADDDERISIKYDQVRCKVYGVMISIQYAPC